MRDLALTEVAHLLGAQVFAVFGLDPCHDLLAVLHVGNADDLDITNLRMAVEELLDLTGIDVLPSPDDHVLDSPDNLDVALVVHLCEVAGVHPAIGVDGLGRAVGVVPVARHHRIASRAELAGLSSADGLAGLGIDDLDLDVGMDSADRADALVDRVIGGGLRAHRGGLGHPVGDGHLIHVHLVDGLFHDLDRAW